MRAAEHSAAEYAEDAAAEHAEHAESSAAEHAAAENAEDAEDADIVLSGATRLLVRMIPAADREAIVGDLLEDARHRGIDGVRLRWWLLGEFGAIGAGLSLARARAWLVLPPVREVVAGLALDGRGAFRGAHDLGAVPRALIYCGTVATLVVGVETLVSALLRAF